MLIQFALLLAKPTQRCTLRLFASCCWGLRRVNMLQTAPKDQLLQQHVREVNNARYMSTQSAASSLGSSSVDRLGKIDKRKLVNQCLKVSCVFFSPSLRDTSATFFGDGQTARPSISNHQFFILSQCLRVGGLFLDKKLSCAFQDIGKGCINEQYDQK